MDFREFYEYVNRLEKPPVGFDFLRGLIAAHHREIGRVDLFAVTHPTPTRDAYYRLGDTDRTSPYEEEFAVGEIVYCESLDLDERELRFALTKELMHVFDAVEARTDTREKFEKLLREIQNRPLPADQSLMFKTELDTRWMASIVLCPKRFRDELIDKYRNGEIADFDVAEEFNIPEWVAPFIMDDYYDAAFRSLLR
ncbi:MAG: hypothetical protein U1D69_04265 [Polynucleobacter sp.]|nr:hypothetical protein [Polynucleobacter sp.]